jgi:hypothetical protein
MTSCSDPTDASRRELGLMAGSDVLAQIQSHIPKERL